MPGGWLRLCELQENGRGPGRVCWWVLSAMSCWVEMDLTSNLSPRLPLGLLSSNQENCPLLGQDTFRGFSRTAPTTVECSCFSASPVAQMVKKLSVMQETWVLSLG